MNRKLLLLIIPALMYGDNLKSLLEFATSNNKIVASNVLIQKAKKSEVIFTKCLLSNHRCRGFL